MSSRETSDARMTDKGTSDKRMNDKRTIDKRMIDKRTNDKRDNEKRNDEKSTIGKSMSDKRIIEKRGNDKRDNNKRDNDKRITDKRMTDKRTTDSKINTTYKSNYNIKSSNDKKISKKYADTKQAEYEDFEDFEEDEVLKEFLKNAKLRASKAGVDHKNSRKPQPTAVMSQDRNHKQQGKSNKAKDPIKKGNEQHRSSIGQEGKPQGKENNKQKKPSGACLYLRECGGCNILKQSYEVELKEKQKLVENLLKSYCRVESIIGMKEPNHYRNKVHVVFDHDKKGNPISGVYEEGTHRVIPVDHCLIHNRKADEIITSIRGMLKSFKIKTYDEDSGYGLLRHVLIRTGFTSGQIMVVLVLASPIFPSKNNFVKALLKLHPEITTIVVNVNDKQTSMVLGEKEQVIYGKGYIEDSLCGKVFRISAKSFYQINPAQTEVLYAKAIELAGLTGSEAVVDAYCGIGTIGIVASDHAKRVIGVELNKDAVKDANVNAKRNNATNIDFYNNDAGDFMIQMAEQKESIDVVFMDPPRTGSTEKFIDAVALLKPAKVVYVSCNPITLERDMKYFVKKGYKAHKAVPVDMFPWTGHVETVVLMSRVNK